MVIYTELWYTLILFIYIKRVINTESLAYSHFIYINIKTVYAFHKLLVIKYSLC